MSSGISSEMMMTRYHLNMSAHFIGFLILYVFIMFVTTVCVFTLCITNIGSHIFQQCNYYFLNVL